MGERKGGGEGGLRKENYCCKVRVCMLFKGEMRCVNLGIENERGIYNIWVLACQGGM